MPDLSTAIKAAFVFAAGIAVGASVMAALTLSYVRRLARRWRRDGRI